MSIRNFDVDGRLDEAVKVKLERNLLTIKDREQEMKSEVNKKLSHRSQLASTGGFVMKE